MSATKVSRGQLDAQTIWGFEGRGTHGVFVGRVKGHLVLGVRHRRNRAERRGGEERIDAAELTLADLALLRDRIDDVLAERAS